MIRERRDVFLSYNNSDAEAVRGLRSALHKRSITTFYDHDDITPGRPWVDELELAINHSRAAAILIGSHGLGRIQKREMQFALVRQATTENEKDSRRIWSSRFFSLEPILIFCQVF